MTRLRRRLRALWCAIQGHPTRSTDELIWNDGPITCTRRTVRCLDCGAALDIHDDLTGR